jgi:phosphoglycerate dehydrogenase-like enzyme
LKPKFGRDVHTEWHEPRMRIPDPIVAQPNVIVTPHFAFSTLWAQFWKASFFSNSALLARKKRY